MMYSNKSSRSLPFLWEALYFALLAVIFSVAIAQRIALPSIPFLDGDSWGYMQAIVAEFAQGTREPTSREFLYPLLLWSMLWVHLNFTVIVVVQHSVGVLAAVVLLLAWHRMRIFLPAGIVIGALHRVGGLVMTAVYLLSCISLFMEHSIRPEALFPFNIALCLWMATEFSRGVFLDSRFGMREWIFGALLIFLPFAAYYLRASWGGGVLCALLPLPVAAVTMPGKWVVKGTSFACGLALVYGLLMLPNERSYRVLKNNSDFYNNDSLSIPETLFCSHIEIIYDLLKEDTRTLPPNDPQYHVVENLVRSLDKSIAHPPIKMFYGYTHLDPDEVRYHGPLDEWKSSFGGNVDQLKDFYYSYYFRAWKKYPLRMVKKVGVQLWYFYSPWRCNVFDRRDELEVLPKMQQSKGMLLCRPSYPSPSFQDYTHKVLALQSTKQVLKIPSLVILLGSILNAVYFPTLVFTLLVALALQMGWFKEAGLRRGSLWALYLFSYNFGTSFTIAFVHTMDVGRYHFGQTLFSAISECFAIVFLFSVLFAIVSRRAAWYFSH